MRRETIDKAVQELPAAVIWDEVNEVVNRIGTNEAKALRVLLYFVMRGSRGTIREKLRCYRKLWRWLAVPTARSAPALIKGGALFAFVFDTPANMNNLLPVFQAAQKRGWQADVMAGDRVDMGRKGLGLGLRIVTVRELVAMTLLGERWDAVRNARKEYATLLTEFGRIGSLWGGSIRRNRSWIVSELALAQVARLALRRLYADWQPACVISTSDLWPFEHAIFAAAQGCRIPSFVIQHGLTNRFWWPCVADKVLVWGRGSERELLDLGAPAARIAVCGMPAADQLFARYRGVGNEPSCRSDLVFVILSDTQAQPHHPGIYANFMRLLKSVVGSTRPVRWLVKLHPMEEETYYRENFDESVSNLQILPKSTKLEDAVREADVACTLWSASGLEAMIMRRPLVVFDVSPAVQDVAWWPKQGGGMYVHTLETMEAFIARALSDAQFLNEVIRMQDGFLSENFANAGRAADAVLDFVEGELRQGVERGGASRCNRARLELGS